MTDAERLRQRFEEHLERNNLKQTRQRRAILDAFLVSTGHVAVEELAEAVQQHMKGVGHATVYRTMKLFTDAGIAHERNFGDGQTRYEPVVHGEHHDHLICEDCGHIFEFEDDLIEEQQQHIAKQHGLTLTQHRHDIFGRCMDRAACPRWAAQQRA